MDNFGNPFQNEKENFDKCMASGEMTQLQERMNAIVVSDFVDFIFGKTALATWTDNVILHPIVFPPMIQVSVHQAALCVGSREASA
jgi:hypothetical protein